VTDRSDGPIPPYVAERIRRSPPAACGVLVGSTPVVAFGDPSLSTVATLGLNPSRIEFEERGVELTGALRRFETLQSLGVDRLDDAPEEIVRQVWHRCARYFHGNPYRWFNRLERMLNAVDASYFEDSACHLDLTQWATDPTWKDLPRPARDRLVAEDADFLRTQLKSESVRLLLLNGQAVVAAFQTVVGGRLIRERETVADRTVTTQLYTGEIGQVQVIAWSTNLQSSFGVTNDLQIRLAERVRQLRGRGGG
jgi:hypothetical protein